MNELTTNQKDMIELIESTFKKVEDVIIFNQLNKSKYIDSIEEALLEAKELLISSITE